MRCILNSIDEIIIEQLAIDMNCEKSDLNSGNIVYTLEKENGNQRKFIRRSPYVEMILINDSLIINGEENYLELIRESVNISRPEDILKQDFIKSHSINFSPSMDFIKTDLLEEYEYLVYKEEIARLYVNKGFENALQYDENKPNKEIIAIVAKDGDKIIGIAGATADSEILWQIGIDVISEYRFKGIGSSLVNRLASIILDMGKVPYYAAEANNIASLKTAINAGFTEKWKAIFGMYIDFRKLIK
ncbi:MAG: GNAT family N-acetyltransferase [Tissierellia bacterium]|nr:GNAT family N-acetyltransferase [Tissierellia bacterium]